MILKQYLKHLSISVFFYIGLAIIFFIYLLGKNNLSILSENNILRFDALLYLDIKNNGYHDNWLCAFFPAFPYLWKIVNASALGMSFINCLLFIVSFSAIAAVYKFEWKQQLFFLSIPSFVFMFVPYTESLFFAAGTLLIIGFNKNKLSFILIGLFLASLIRPTTFVFIPAVLGTYFFSEYSLKQTIKKSIVPTIVLIAGLIITISIHFFYTGKWFVFFEAQKLWKNHLHFPQLPLTSWGGDASVRLDGSALAFSLFCGGFIIYFLSKKMKKQIVFSKELIFSLLYFFGTAMLILAYRDGNLYSLNRFIYGTPFIVFTLYYFISNYNFKWNHVWFVLIVTEAFWFLFNSYNHLHNLLMFSTVSLYFILILFLKHKSKIISTASYFSLIIINCIGLIKLFYRFLNNTWIG